MQPLLTSDAYWRAVNATMLAVFIAIWLALAPGAMAHGAHHNPVVGKSSFHELSTAHVSKTTAPTDGYVISPCWKAHAFNESCLDGTGHDHADHIGCCAGMASCVSGCGAMIMPEEFLYPTPHGTLLESSAILAAVGIETLPSDPPPRAAI